MTAAPVLMIFAHPYPDRSIANRKLLAAAEDLEGVSVRSLYDLYPTFDIDVPAEQAALRQASVLVLQHPMYWYSAPSLLKHWFDKVLARGFAYGQGGKALWGKRCFWVVTTGGDEQAFGSHGMHNRPFQEFSPVIEQTALFCGMLWEEPLVVYGAHRISESELGLAASAYRERLAAYVRTAPETPPSGPDALMPGEPGRDAAEQQTRAGAPTREGDAT
jgi:glutathione-regulated potassium-efflux system ancillary protein KefF